MDASEELREDIRYIRNIVDRPSFSPEEFVIALVWATVNLVGLSLYDLSLVAGGVFWLIALPTFGIGSGWYFERKQIERGELDKSLGKRHALHWTSIPIFLLMCNFVFLTQDYDPVLAGQLVVLVVGLVYYLGGVHFWRGYLFGGIGLASGLVWLAILDRFAWTLTGVVTFTALTVSAFVYRARYVRQS